MNKLQMAHDWFMKHADGNSSYIQTEVEYAWEYADAMQAEADKREKEEAQNKRDEMRKLMNADNTFIEKEGQHFDDVEWQPDWSQAPEWCNYFVVDSDFKSRWVLSESGRPYIGLCGTRWFSIGVFNSLDAPSFGYTGDWRHSLRKRPE